MLPIYLRHRRPDPGVGGRPRLGVHHRRDRPDRRVRRARTSASSRRGRRCWARWPASRSRSSRCGRPPRCGRRRGSRCPVLGAHPRRLHHRHPAAGQLPGRPRGAAGRHGDRLDRRLHVASDDVERRRPRPSRSASRRCNVDLLFERARRDLAAARHRHPARHLQLHRGHDQRRERGGGRRQLQPAPASCSPTAPARSSARRSARPFPPAVYIGHPGWKAAGGRTGYSLATGVVIALLCFLGLFGAARRAAARCRRSCRSCSTSAC